MRSLLIIFAVTLFILISVDTVFAQTENGDIELSGAASFMSRKFEDAEEAWWVALNNIDPERDVRFSMGPVDVLDHSARAFTYGSKMGIDATKKWEYPEIALPPQKYLDRVSQDWKKYGLDS